MRSPAMHGEFIIFNDERENGKVSGNRSQVLGLRSQENLGEIKIDFAFPDS
jgi:hypothetical protein